MEKDMPNMDVVKGQWKQFRGQAKIWWDKLTDNDLDQINGERERLIGKLQERYGYTREQAVNDINKHLQKMERITMP